MECPTCGKQVWNYQQGIYRCPEGHTSMAGEPSNLGRTLTPLERTVGTWMIVLAGLVAFLAGFLIGAFVL